MARKTKPPPGTPEHLAGFIPVVKEEEVEKVPEKVEEAQNTNPAAVEANHKTDSQYLGNEDEMRLWGGMNALLGAFGLEGDGVVPENDGIPAPEPAGLPEPVSGNVVDAPLLPEPEAAPVEEPQAVPLHNIGGID